MNDWVWRHASSAFLAGGKRLDCGLLSSVVSTGGCTVTQLLAHLLLLPLAIAGRPRSSAIATGRRGLAALAALLSACQLEWPSAPRGMFGDAAFRCSSSLGESCHRPSDKRRDTTRGRTPMKPAIERAPAIEPAQYQYQKSISDSQFSRANIGISTTAAYGCESFLAPLRCVKDEFSSMRSVF